MSGPNITIPDHIQLVGETGHFYTVVAVENIPEATTLETSRIVYEEQEQQEGDAGAQCQGSPVKCAYKVNEHGTEPLSSK